MSYCPNPECNQRKNFDNLMHCQCCGTPLLIQGHYRLLRPLRPLTKRDFTEVFEVDDCGTSKVLKLLKKDRSVLAQLFQRESLCLQSVQHPGVPKCEASFTLTIGTRSYACLVMDKIGGENLAQVVAKSGAISEEVASQWLQQLVEILEAIHQVGFFHRDIKPSNIVLKPDGHLALIDFGTCRSLTQTFYQKRLDGAITQVFSSGYTAVEQIEGRAVPQSDFYALGRTFVYLLVGIEPHTLPMDAERRLLWRERAPHISDAFAELIEDLMAPDVGDRPGNTEAIRWRLEHLRLNRLLRILRSQPFKMTSSFVIGLSFLGCLSVPWLSYQAGLRAASEIATEQSRLNTAQPPLIEADRKAHQTLESEKTQLLLNQAREALLNEQLETAVTLFAEVIALGGASAQVHNDLGVAFSLQGDLEKSTLSFRQAVTLDPDYFVAHYHLARDLDAKNYIDLAEEEYTIALRLAIKQGKPERAINLIKGNLSRILNLQETPEEAEQIALQSLAFFRNTNTSEDHDFLAAIYKNLGWSYLQQGNYNLAQDALNRSIELDETRPDAHCLLAQVLDSIDRLEDSIKSWKRCLNRNDSLMENLKSDAIELRLWRPLARTKLEINNEN